jgi:hypothetical protein
MNSDDYNYSMEVKYYLIYEGLLSKQKNNDGETKDEEENYTLYDIESICQKIYIDEYSSVFNCDSFVDDMIDVKLRRLYNHSITSEKIKQLLNDLTTIYNNKTNITYDEDDTLYYTFLMLFSYETFYLVHKLLNAHTNNTIDDCDELLSEIFKQFNRQLERTC